MLGSQLPLQDARRSVPLRGMPLWSTIVAVADAGVRQVLILKLVREFSGHDA